VYELHKYDIALQLKTVVYETQSRFLKNRPLEML